MSFSVRIDLHRCLYVLLESYLNPECYHLSSRRISNRSGHNVEAMSMNVFRLIIKSIYRETFHDINIQIV